MTGTTYEIRSLSDNQEQYLWVPQPIPCSFKNSSTSLRWVKVLVFSYKDLIHGLVDSVFQNIGNGNSKCYNLVCTLQIWALWRLSIWNGQRVIIANGHSTLPTASTSFSMLQARESLSFEYSTPDELFVTIDLYTLVRWFHKLHIKTSFNLIQQS